MSLRKNIKLLSLSMLTALLLTACSTKDKPVQSHVFHSNTYGLKLKQESPAIVFVRPNAKPLSSYKYFMIDPIKVDYNDPTVKKLSPQKIKKLQNYFYNSITNHLKEANYKIVKKVQPNTMEISFVLSGIKAPEQTTPKLISAILPIAIKVGEVKIEASFKNTNTNQLDAIVINRSQGSKILNNSPWSTWADIENSFDRWAEGLVKHIKKHPSK